MPAPGARSVAAPGHARYRQPMTSFDPLAMAKLVAQVGHNSVLGIRVIDVGADWCELALDYRADLIGQPETGLLASGPIITLADMAASIAIWAKRGAFEPIATVDLRVDYLRAATPGHTVTARVQCLRLTRRIAFVRGQAHDGDAADPIALVAATFALTDEA